MFFWSCISAYKSSQYISHIFIDYFIVFKENRIVRYSLHQSFYSVKFRNRITNVGILIRKNKNTVQTALRSLFKSFFKISDICLSIRNNCENNAICVDILALQYPVGILTHFRNIYKSEIKISRHFFLVVITRRI